MFEAWKAAKSERVEIKSRGNSMTQKLYAETILPKHIERIKELEARFGRKILFQEDGDSSHGHRSANNAPEKLRRASDLQILIHPPQSPDLNPIEAIWEIMKQRLRGGRWKTVEEFKEAILAAWRSVTQAQIRRRIREMPWRCRRVVELKGARVKSNLW